MSKSSKLAFATLIARLIIFAILFYYIISFLSDLNSSVKQPNNEKIVNLNEDRLQVATIEKKSNLTKQLNRLGIKWDEFNLFIRAFKEEGKLEVWGKNIKDKNFKKIQIYDFCATSGRLGPKRKSGDLQIPEGIYHIDRFNEKSNYYLSLGLNYPNKSDRKRGVQNNLGGDIFIHGDCVTIGCIPVTDDKIKEVFLLAFQAKENGQVKIPVHIFPAKLTDRKLAKLGELVPTQKAFWNELKPFYDHFESTQQLPYFKIDAGGRYVLNP